MNCILTRPGAGRERGRKRGGQRVRAQECRLCCMCCVLQRMYECSISDIPITHSLFVAQEAAARSRSGASLFMCSNIDS